MRASTENFDSSQVLKDRGLWENAESGKRTLLAMGAWSRTDQGMNTCSMHVGTWDGRRGGERANHHRNGQRPEAKKLDGVVFMIDVMVAGGTPSITIGVEALVDCLTRVYPWCSVEVGGGQRFRLVPWVGPVAFSSVDVMHTEKALGKAI